MLKFVRNLIAVLLAVPAATASAQTVAERGGEAYQPLGARVGSFAILPSVVVAGVYDSNVFAVNRARQDAFILDVRPELVVKSDWSRHALEFKVSGQILDYDRFASENQGNVFTGANGIFDISNDARITAYSNYTHAHEARGSGNSFQRFDAPVVYDRVEGGAALRKSFNRLWTELGGTARNDEFQNATIRGVISDQSYRNVMITEVVNRTGYEFSPKSSVFVESAYGWRDYHDNVFDNEGYRVLAGIQAEASRVLRGEISGGWMSYRGSHEASVGGIETYNYRARAYWEPTPLMLVMLFGGRDVGVSTEGGKSLSVTSDIGVKVDYELLRNLLLSGRFGFQNTDYRSTARHDNQYKGEFLAEYLLDRNWSVLASYAYTNFISTAADLDYDKHVVSVGLRARY